MNRYPAKPMMDQMAQHGRYGDTMLVHMNPIEVAGIAALSPTGQLTTNPVTGQPEAFLPLLFGALGGALKLGTLGTAALSGIGTAAITGDLKRGLLAGVTSGLTAGIGEAFAGADAAADVATTSADGLQSVVDSGGDIMGAIGAGEVPASAMTAAGQAGVGAGTDTLSALQAGAYGVDGTGSIVSASAPYDAMLTGSAQSAANPGLTIADVRQLSSAPTSLAGTPADPTISQQLFGGAEDFVNRGIGSLGTSGQLVGAMTAEGMSQQMQTQQDFERQQRRLQEESDAKRMQAYQDLQGAYAMAQPDAQRGYSPYRSMMSMNTPPPYVPGMRAGGALRFSNGGSVIEDGGSQPATEANGGTPPGGGNNTTTTGTNMTFDAWLAGPGAAYQGSTLADKMEAYQNFIGSNSDAYVDPNGYQTTNGNGNQTTNGNGYQTTNGNGNQTTNTQTTNGNSNTTTTGTNMSFADWLAGPGAAYQGSPLAEQMEAYQDFIGRNPDTYVDPDGTTTGTTTTGSTTTGTTTTGTTTPGPTTITPTPEEQAVLDRAARGDLLGPQGQAIFVNYYDRLAKANQQAASDEAAAEAAAGAAANTLYIQSGATNLEALNALKGAGLVPQDAYNWFRRWFQESAQNGHDIAQGQFLASEQFPGTEEWLATTDFADSSKKYLRQVLPLIQQAATSGIPLSGQEGSVEDIVAYNPFGTYAGGYQSGYGGLDPVTIQKNLRGGVSVAPPRDYMPGFEPEFSYFQEDPSRLEIPDRSYRPTMRFSNRSDAYFDPILEEQAYLQQLSDYYQTLGGYEPDDVVYPEETASTEDDPDTTGGGEDNVATEDSGGDDGSTDTIPTDDSGGDDGSTDTVDPVTPPAPTPTLSREALNALYQELFGRDALDAGYNYWLSQVTSGAVSMEDLRDALIASAQGSDKDYYNQYVLGAGTGDGTDDGTGTTDDGTGTTDDGTGTTDDGAGTTDYGGYGDSLMLLTGNEAKNYVDRMFDVTGVDPYSTGGGSLSGQERAAQREKAKLVIRDLFYRYLGREPDSEALDHYSNRIVKRGGAVAERNLRKVAQEIMESEEGQNYASGIRAGTITPPDRTRPTGSYTYTNIDEWMAGGSGSQPMELDPTPDEEGYYSAADARDVDRFLHERRASLYGVLVKADSKAEISVDDFSRALSGQTGRYGGRMIFDPETNSIYEGITDDMSQSEKDAFLGKLEEMRRRTDVPTILGVDPSLLTNAEITKRNAVTGSSSGSMSQRIGNTQYFVGDNGEIVTYQVKDVDYDQSPSFKGMAEGGTVPLRTSMGDTAVSAGGIANVPTEFTASMPSKEEFSMVTAAVLGRLEDPDPIINMFVEKYGPEMFQKVRDYILNNVAPDAQTEGMVRGRGSGMDDKVPGMIGDQQPVAVSPGEFIVPADVVSGLGDGSSDAGAKELDRMMERVRMARGGTTEQAPPIDARKMMPA